MKYTLTPLLIFLLFSCSVNSKKDISGTVDGIPGNLNYATGFDFSINESHTEVVVTRPFKGAKESITYWLARTINNLPEAPENVQIIQVPLKSIVATSTTHIPLLEYLGELETLVGFPTTDYISSQAARARIDAGNIIDLGVDASMNMESLIDLGPDLVMTYSVTGDFNQQGLIQKAGIPTLVNAEYLEEHPLGRAEWIKLVGLLYNKQDMADSIFSEIEARYLEAAELAQSQPERPSAFSGVVYGDTWFLPGGKNYASKILSDAGIDYLWKSDNNHGFLELSFESVFDVAQEADLWIGMASYSTLHQIAEADSRYTSFKAFQDGNLHNYTKRVNPFGGNEYLELGYLRPDLIIKDLIKIAHPTALPDHESFFFKS